MIADPLRAFDGIVRPLRIDGAPSGPLAGTTFVVKDLYDVQGYRTGAGNPDWERTHAAAAATAPAIERLLRAGATMTGKSCTDELAFSLDGINVHYGTPLNPRYPSRLPGGSSSGSASAVAAGLVDFALGTDTSGSIRVPSSYCGIYGFRPSHGAVATAGVVPLAPSFDTVGWLARDPSMLARVGSVLLDAPVTVSNSGFDTLHVVEDAFELADGASAARLRAAATRAGVAFRAVDRIRLSDDRLSTWLTTFRDLKQWEAWQVHGTWIRAVDPKMAPNIRSNFESASQVTEKEWRSAQAARSHLLEALSPYLAGDAVLCLPSAWTIAPLKTASSEELARNRATDLTLCSIASLAGAPQISTPLADDAGAVGLSFVAARGADRRLLALAEELASVGQR